MGPGNHRFREHRALPSLLGRLGPADVVGRKRPPPRAFRALRVQTNPAGAGAERPPVGNRPATSAGYREAPQPAHEGAAAPRYASQYRRRTPR